MSGDDRPAGSDDPSAARPPKAIGRRTSATPSPASRSKPRATRERTPARPAPGRQPTVHDVARAAGVSASTVSRALHGRGYASPEVRELVAAAAARIGYVADANARSLRVRTSTTVGVLISDLRNPYYAVLAAGIEAGLRGAGKHMVLVNDDSDPAMEATAVASFASMRVCGVIVTPVSERVARAATQFGLPIVCVDRPAGRARTDVVMADDHAGGRLVTTHLLEAGRSPVAILLDEQRWSTGAGRLAGYREALAAGGVEPDDDLVQMTSWRAEDAAASTRDLLARRPDIRALITANNVLAQGAFTALRAAGVVIGRDVALASFDDLPWMTMVDPPVTAITQHPFEIGRRAAEVLLERIQSDTADTAGAGGAGAADARAVVRDLIEPQLIVRASTGG
ncbi:MAG TPA: LacI family DNA-binding transcriptional regulator [Actinopolymorphaceae bacterium]|jgi:LacI family transcriptional regulator